MKVTDEIIDVAYKAYNACALPIGQNMRMRAALEAVFNKFPEATKRVDTQVIKNFVDMMDNMHLGCTLEIKQQKEYRALRASISPVSEDKVHTISAKDMPPQSHWQPTDTQDNDGCRCDKKYGFINETTDNKVICLECRKIIESNFSFTENWILWNNKGGVFSEPEMDGNIKVDALYADKGHVVYNRKVLDLDFGKRPSYEWSSEIIAYRIIEEPKEQKKEVCGCKIPARCWGGLEGLCGVCHKPLEKKDSKEENKEPKKQTLLEAFDKFNNQHYTPTMRQYFEFLSGYLEEQNKCK